jgi:hypothetical protein
MVRVPTSGQVQIDPQIVSERPIRSEPQRRISTGTPLIRHSPKGGSCPLQFRIRGCIWSHLLLPVIGRAWLG